MTKRYMADRGFRSSAFPSLAREIFDTIHSRSSATSASIARELRPRLSPPSRAEKGRGEGRWV